MPKNKQNIPQETARRLSLYLRSLKRLKGSGVNVASSEDVTRFLNISSTQLRKDLSYFGEFGKRGVGYDVNALVKDIEKILGTDTVWDIAIVGVGKLGSALLGYPGFFEFNLKVSAAFDSDPGKVGKITAGIKIEDISRMSQIIRRKNIKIAVLSVPAVTAQETAEKLAKCGIRAILNFAPVNLVLPKDIFVSNVDMATELESLVYKLKRKVY
jgi:redox-sensing transcriptional repressor